MSSFYIISGDDDFARKQRARECAIQLCDDPEPENCSAAEVIAGDEPTFKQELCSARFLESLRTPPFLCGRKLIWLRHHPDLDNFASDRPDEATAELLKLLREPLPPDIDVLIDGPGLDRRRTIFKDLKNAGAVIEIFSAAKTTDKNYGENRRQQLADFARNSGKKLSHDAMQYLTEAIGGDSGTLANELEKLLCYCGDKSEITLADCRAVVSRTQEALSWEFTSAVVSGDRQRALFALGTLLEGKENGTELRMLASLSMEYQRMIQTRLAMKQLQITRPNPNTFSSLSPELKSSFPDNPLLKLHPFRAFKVCEAAARFNGGVLAEKLTLIRDVYRKLVSGGGDNRILLEQLVCKLCG